MKSIRGTIPAHIRQQVTQLRVLEDALRDCLPAECCNHCRVAGIFGETLLLVADSPAWRSRLHFYSDRIISHFSHLGKSPVHRVRIRVAAGTGIQPPASRCDPPLRLPAEAAQGFASLARDTEDRDLRKALERLASHSRGS
ncbi:MAG: DUF721 domain-containing protein [Halofilum sp. (in: g-proteobacteria)]|nr:DUF721 domain-containing protein [Halofilum sp. (in: g-proteobacteria)]